MPRQLVYTPPVDSCTISAGEAIESRMAAEPALLFAVSIQPAADKGFSARLQHASAISCKFSVRGFPKWRCLAWHMLFT